MINKLNYIKEPLNHVSLLSILSTYKRDLFDYVVTLDHVDVSRLNGEYSNKIISSNYIIAY